MESSIGKFRGGASGRKSRPYDDSRPCMLNSSPIESAWPTASPFARHLTLPAGENTCPWRITNWAELRRFQLLIRKCLGMALRSTELHENDRRRQPAAGVTRFFAKSGRAAVAF